MPGESAEAVARRQREKAARLERSAELWQRGADGERATAAALEALPSHYWTVLHDVAWPGRPRANIDHVAVGPPGVFVIDSKNWSGSITLRAGVLRQSGRSRASAVDGVDDAAHAVARVLDPTGSAVTQGVLCLTGETHASGTAGPVVICSVNDLSEYLTNLPPRIHEVSLPGLAEQVKSRLGTSAQRLTPPPVTTGSARAGSAVDGPIAAPARPPAPATPTWRPGAPLSEPGSFKIPWLRLVKPVAGVVLLLVMIVQPQVITGVAFGLSRMFVSQLDLEIDTPPRVESTETIDDTKKSVKERRREKREQREAG